MASKPSSDKPEEQQNASDAKSPKNTAGESTPSDDMSDIAYPSDLFGKPSQLSGVVPPSPSTEPLASRRTEEPKTSQTSTPSEKPHYHGHRDRLRKRLMEQGEQTLADYEVLELVLFRALPRRDTKPIAKDLLNRFGSFAEVLNASEQELRKVPFIKDRAIEEFRLIRAAGQRMLSSDIQNKPVLSSWSKVLDHCRAAMAYEPREQFRILFLDKRNRLILDEVQQTGTVDHTPVYVREVCRRALEVNATAIILAHNHPSGDPTPSRGDINMTKEIEKVAKGLGILVHDHIIIAKEGHASFKALGLL